MLRTYAVQRLCSIETIQNAAAMSSSRLERCPQRRVQILAIAIAVLLTGIFGLSLLPVAARRQSVTRGLAASVVTSDLNTDAESYVPVPTLFVVVARFEEDTSWVDAALSGMPHAVCQQGAAVRREPDLGALSPPLNNGREASCYLAWIVANYARLPSVTAFVHGHRRTSVHTPDCDIVPLLRSLRVETVTGFHSLQRLPYEVNISQVLEHSRLQAEYEALLEPEIGPPPAFMIQHTCCGQFVVHRSAILRRPLASWRRLYDFAVSAEVAKKAETGRVFEHLWGPLFSAGGFAYGEAFEAEGSWCGPPPGASADEARDIAGAVLASRHDCNAYWAFARKAQSCAFMREHIAKTGSVYA